MAPSMQFAYALSPANPTSRVLPTGIFGRYTERYIKIITAMCFVIIKTCKQPKYIPRREWLNYKT